MTENEIKEMEQKSHILLNHLIWKTTDHTFQMKSFSLDCYRFCFKRTLNEDEQYAFIQFVNTLDLKDRKTIMKLYVYLYQQDIPFILRFKYNRKYTWKQNFGQWKSVRIIRKKIKPIEKTLKDIDIMTI